MLSKEQKNYILMDDVVCYVQAIATDEPSLSETAKFLLQKYDDAFFDDPSKLPDDNIYQMSISGAYVSAFDYKSSMSFRKFLEFVARYDCFDGGVSEDNPNWIQYNQYIGLYLKKSDLVLFLEKFCGLSDLPDINNVLSELEDKRKADEWAVEQAGRVLSKEEARESLEHLQNVLGLRQEITDLKENKTNLEALLEKCKIEKSHLESLLEKLKKELKERPVQKEAAPKYYPDFEIIQKHRQHAPEFEALIQTLLHHAKDYDYVIGSQPVKAKVALTYIEKSGLSTNSRRPQEVARILGFPEENS